MADVDFTANFDDSQVERSMNDLIKNVQKGEDAFQDLSRTADRSMNQIAKDTNQASESIENAKLALSNFGATMDKNTKQINLNSQAASNLSFQLQDVFVQLQGGQGVFRTLIQQGPQITSIFGGVGNTFRFAGQQAKRLLRNLVTLRGGIKALAASTGILLALSIISYFTKFGGVVDFVGEKLSQLTQIVDVIVGRLASFGKSIIGFIKGQNDFNDVMNAGADAVSGLGQAFTEAAKRGELLFKIQKQLNQEATNLKLINIDLQRQAEQARLFAEDETRTVSERIALLKQAASIEQQIRDAQISNLSQRAALLAAQGKDQEEILDLQREALELEKESKIAAVENSQEVNALIQERLESTRELTRTLREANATLAGPAEVAKAQYEAATEAIQQLREEARLLGLDLNFDALETIAQAQFERASDAALGELQKLPDEIDKILSNTSFLGRGADFVEEGRQAGENLGEAYAEGVTISAEPILEELKLAIQEAFDLNDDQFNNLIGNLGTAYNALTDGILANTDAQIIAQDRIVQAVQERVNETNRLLEAERQKAANGYANNVDRYEQQLKEQIKAQEEAENKRLQLEQKAARQRLIINAAEQASNLVLAAAKLTAAEAGKGIIGIGIALAGLATIFSIVSQAKAQAAQFQELPKFRTGTDYVQGAGSHQSDGVLARLSVGERVVDAPNNSMIPRGTSNEDLVHHFQLGKMVADGIAFDRPDFGAMMQRINADRDRILELQMKQQTKAMQTAYTKAANTAADKMIDYLKSRPIEWFDQEGNKFTERVVGGKIERVRFVDEENL